MMKPTTPSNGGYVPSDDEDLVEDEDLPLDEDDLDGLGLGWLGRP